MAFNERLATRLRKLLPQATERRMFGGIGLMERGHLVAGVLGDDLIVRVPAEETAQWLARPGTRAMVAARPMRGWVRVAGRSVARAPELAAWVERSRDVTRRLPPK